MISITCASCRDEPDPITDPHQAVRAFGVIEEFLLCSADDPITPGRFEGVDACLELGNAHRTLGHTQSRCLESWSVEPPIEGPEVGKAGEKADGEDRVDG